ncbi:MAG: DNA translocase FtsK [Nanoarchaeota archaeon]|nr:DNA translocase FtsK [Nanoarchaeota archaeon]
MVKGKNEKYEKKSGNGRGEKESASRRIENIHPEIKRSIWVIALVAIAAILLLAAAGKAGPVGDMMFAGLHKLFGIGYYLLPLVSLFYVFALVASGERPLFGVTAVGGIIFIIGCLGFLDIVAPGKGGLTGVLVGTLEKPFGKIASLVIMGGIVAASFLVMLNRPLQLSKCWTALGLKQKNGAKKKDGEEEIKIILPPEPPRAEQKKKEEKEEEEKEEKEPTIREGHAAAGIGEMKRVEILNYVFPPISLLGTSTEKPTIGDLRANANIIKRTFESFGITVEMGEISVGPSVTRYTLKPAEGIKLARIIALHQDLALALAAHPIRIEAPIPGKSLVGIEVPNKVAAIVRLGSLLLYPEFQKSSPLTFVIGRDVNGDPIFADIAKMPHLLIAGATGSGKSIILHDLIVSLLYKNSPATLRFIMADPKRVELTAYNDIPHLLAPVITENKKAIGALRWATQEMERRYQVLMEGGSRDIKSYNSKHEEERLPYILIIIDELADLMSTYGREVEGTIIRLAQMARATGIHLILTTQRPSVEVITGLIKANIPARIALQVASQIDSRTILDSGGAEKLLGRGDLLFLSSDFSKPKRIQGSFIEEREIKKVADFIRKHNKAVVQEEKEEAEEHAEEFEKLAEKSPPAQGGNGNGNGNGNGVNFEEYAGSSDEDDDLYEEAVEVVRAAGKASTSLLQRRLKVGYARAARLMDMMEERGVVGPGDGAKPREILI